MLERHVNQHFKPTNKDDEGVNGKLIRRKGKKLRLRRQPFTGKFLEYFKNIIYIQKLAIFQLFFYIFSKKI